MKKIKSLYIVLILLIVSALTFNSCRTSEETSACFPNSTISVVLNLNLPAYQNLQNPSGWIYVNEQGSGTRGLIVVRNASGFKVYDRNAPHLCPETSTTLNVVDNIKIACAKDGSEWILLTGEPVKVAQVPPKTYLSHFNPGNNVLTVYN